MNDNPVLVSHRLERAWKTLQEARLLAKSEYWNTCMNRLYYASFYAVNALLITKGLSSSKHTGVRSLFNLHYVNTGMISKEWAAFYNDLYDYRRDCDYKDFFEIDPDIVCSVISKAGDFIRTISQLIDRSIQSI